jgi:transposase
MSQSQTLKPNLNGRAQTGAAPDARVQPKVESWHFSAECKLRILAEAEVCAGRGQIGALLGRERLYASHLDKWRRQREPGVLGQQRRGRQSDPQASESA